MAIYQYINPFTSKIVEVEQSMDSVHEYSENGIKFNRVFTVPNASVDTIINPFSQKDYINKTANKKGTYGEALQHSAELSEKRLAIAGVDTVKEGYFNDYEKSHHGMKHPEKKKQEANANLKKLGFEIT